MYKIMSVCILSFLLSSCAKPNYAVANENARSAETKGDLSCPYLLPNFQLCFDLSWKTPQNQQSEVFDLRFWQKGSVQGTYVDPEKTLAVILWMPGMGHGSSPVEIQKTATGIYAVTRVNFIMPGEWEIRVQIKDGKNVLDQTIIPINIQ